jgi:peptidoglycan/xylan/chitin deacetylase (PgdA/CDA1 family)
VPILSGASGTAYFDDLTVIQDTPTQSAVTIMFDDSLDNHYMVAKPLMDALGFKGTLAVITGTLGQAGSLTMQNLKTFQSAGWEISSHSINHEDITTLTTARATREIVNSYQTLKNNGFTVTDFVYPYGAFNANLNAIGSPYYKSMRSFQAGNNPQGVYPYDVKVRQVTNATTASDVAAWVAEGKANKKWEVLVFHAVTASSDDIYYTDPTVFKNMLDAIKASGVPVVTYAQGVSLFAQKP